MVPTVYFQIFIVFKKKASAKVYIVRKQCLNIISLKINGDCQLQQNQLI